MELSDSEVVVFRSEDSLEKRVLSELRGERVDSDSVGKRGYEIVIQ